MDEGTVRMQCLMYAMVAEMHAIIATIEGMKAANTERTSQGLALAWPESSFYEESNRLNHVSDILRKDL